MEINVTGVAIVSLILLSVLVALVGGLIAWVVYTMSVPVQTRNEENARAIRQIMEGVERRAARQRPRPRQVTNATKAKAAAAVAALVNGELDKVPIIKKKKEKKLKLPKLIKKLVEKRKKDANGLVARLLIRKTIEGQDLSEKHRVIYKGKFNRVDCEGREYPPSKRTLTMHTISSVGKIKKAKYNVWVPYTLFLRKWSSEDERWVISIGFSVKPIETIEDKIWIPFLPNMYNSGRACTSGGEDFDDAVNRYWSSVFLTGELQYGLNIARKFFDRTNFSECMKIWETMSLEEVLKKIKDSPSSLEKNEMTIKDWSRLRRFRIIE